MKIAELFPASPVMALLLGAVVAGCGPMPDLRRGFSPTAAPAPRSAPVAPMAGAPAAGMAEQACSDEARARDLSVRAVVGSREVEGEGGAVTSRDVMLRVERRGQVYDVRCRFLYESGEARIMSL